MSARVQIPQDVYLAAAKAHFASLGNTDLDLDELPAVKACWMEASRLAVDAAIDAMGLTEELACIYPDGSLIEDEWMTGNPKKCPGGSDRSYRLVSSWLPVESDQ